MTDWIVTTMLLESWDRGYPPWLRFDDWLDDWMDRLADRRKRPR